MVNILNVSKIIVRIILGLITLSRSTVDALVCKGIDKLLKIALYEPRLTLLVTTVEDQLFGEKNRDPSSTELCEQQRMAKQSLEKISIKFGCVADTIQSPALNKQLIYCLFDIIVAELYPELNTNISKE